MEAIKITNPQWLGYIAPRIAEFAAKLNVAGISYETLYTYFVNSVQHSLKVEIQNKDDGGPKLEDMSEFWVVLEEDGTPVGFAHWYVRGLPHVGKVMCDSIYSWGKNREIFRKLLDEFEDFGRRHRATIYECDALNDAVVRLYNSAAKSKGYNLKVTSLRHCVMEKE